jgi:hypothetical protein
MTNSREHNVINIYIGHGHLGFGRIELGYAMSMRHSAFDIGIIKFHRFGIPRPL